MLLNCQIRNKIASERGVFFVPDYLFNKALFPLLLCNHDYGGEFMKKIYLIVNFICCIILISASVYSFERCSGYFIRIISQPKLSNQFTGTYTCDENTLCSLTAEQGKVFYLLDYQNVIFLEGTFVNKGNNENLLHR